VRGQTVDYPSNSVLELSEICVSNRELSRSSEAIPNDNSDSGVPMARYSTGSEGVSIVLIHHSTKGQRRRQYLEHHTHLVRKVHGCVVRTVQYYFGFPSIPFATLLRPIPRHPAPWLLDCRRSTDLDLCLIVDLCSPKVRSAAMPSQWKYNCIV
jgi:hypothetical protein